MKRHFMLPIFVCCLFLTGCAGLKNIQDLTYIVAIGMDFDEEKDEYTVYLQALNFANVAKQEGPRPTEPIPIFIATAKGETLNLAVSELYKKSEPPLFFGHVSTVLLSKRIVTHRFREVIEDIGRNRSLRPTLRVLTTEEDISEVFSIKALFNYPAVYTVLFKKNSIELSQDEIKPMTLMKFLRVYYEPMGLARLPTVRIDKKTWQADKNNPVLYLDGYSIFHNQQFVKDLSLNDSVFINWMLEDRVTLDQKVKKDQELLAVIKLATPEMKVNYEEGTDSPKFSIEVSANADVLEKIKDVPLQDLKQIIDSDLKKRITSLYQEGVDNKIDILNVGEKWYRQQPKKYAELKQTKEFYLDKDSLSNVKVDVKIFHFNSYKYDQRGNGGY
ncbi:Ger(x)C family spore germination protein [Cytobacillus sp. FJAT-54145]|uniref:Ger(X)C family spore germination protein n=1 Tax=Cytobacillus spartinae TaxID=3299023 RepID=A0ABW6K6T0_9BACI